MSNGDFCIDRFSLLSAVADAAQVADRLCYAGVGVVAVLLELERYNAIILDLAQNLNDGAEVHYATTHLPRLTSL